MQEGVQIENITAGYIGKPNVLQNVTIDLIPKGTLTALIGPNAAGKSTLLRSLVGLLPATGTVRWQNENLLTINANKRASIIGYMPQLLTHNISLTVIESLISLLKASPFDQLSISIKEARTKALDVLQKAGIVELAMEPLGQLSGGQRQMVSFTQAIIRQPSLLLLDEPTSALDLQHQVAVMQLMKEYANEGNTVIVVLHDINLAARWADRLVVLDKGNIAAQGKPLDVIHSELLRHVYNVEAVVEITHDHFAQVHIKGLVKNDA